MGRLAQLLGMLDGAPAALEPGLGPHRSDTTVVVVTEFGRTVHMKGTMVTDHGTGTVAFLVRAPCGAGGWWRTGPGQRCQACDLMPTADLRAVLKGVLADRWGLSADVLARSVFPGSDGVKSSAGLSS